MTVSAKEIHDQQKYVVILHLRCRIGGEALCADPAQAQDDSDSKAIRWMTVSAKEIHDQQKYVVILHLQCRIGGEALCADPAQAQDDSDSKAIRWMTVSAKEFYDEARFHVSSKHAAMIHEVCCHAALKYVVILHLRCRIGGEALCADPAQAQDDSDSKRIRCMTVSAKEFYDEARFHVSSKHAAMIHEVCCHAALKYVVILHLRCRIGGEALCADPAQAQDDNHPTG